jgi:branched-chain amino acid transport system ATP-binding protein
VKAQSLEVVNLSVKYGKAVAVVDVSLHVGMGECVAVVGANGAGKSTVGKAVAGLVPAAGGQVTFHGEPVHTDAVRKGIVYVPEGRMVFPQMTVEDNLKVGAFVRRRERDWREQRTAMYDLVPRLADRSQIKAGLLSGGEQQLLAIARALMARPRMLVLDEPSLGLSPAAIRLVTGFLDQLRADTGVSMLLLEQNTAFAARLADRGMVMTLGEVETEGLSKDDLAAVSVSHDA